MRITLTTCIITMGFLSGLFGKHEEQKNEWVDQIVWLSPSSEKNPFSVDALDCRVVALGFTSMTEDKHIAETYNRLRSDDGTRHMEHLPKEYLTVDCELSFAFNGDHAEGSIFRAKQMEDKWDFSVYDDKLYLSRSWTGQLLHVAELEFTGSHVRIKRIYSNRSAVYDNPDFAIENMFFLVSSHLGTKPVPFPIPPGMKKEDKKKIALAGFNSYGRRAKLASYETKLERTNQ